MTIRLEVHPAPGCSYAVALAGPRVELGRDPASDVPLAGETCRCVSWHHAGIELLPARARLCDRHSRNGTYLNDRRLDSPAFLKAGDWIQLGRTGPRLRVLALDSFPEVAGSAAAPMSGARRRRPAACPEGRPRVRTPSPRPIPSSRLPESFPADRPPARESVRNLLASLSRGQWLQVLGIASGIIGLALLATTVLAGFPARQNRYAEVPAFARPEAPSAGVLAKWPSTDSATVFQRTLRSTAWVRADRNWGSGCLVDRHRRHILTAYHVVRDSGSLAVCFPAHDANGKEITDRAHYHARMWIAGRVVKQDERHDLALLALDSLPPDVVELPLAARSPDPGENVHTVGTAGMTGPLWVYSHGNVRQVCQREYDFDSGQHIASWVILTQNPTNPGDSGGPLVNDRAELIGVTSGGEPRVDLVNWFIDLREIKVFLTDLGR